MTYYEKKNYLHETFYKHNFNYLYIGEYKNMEIKIRYCNCGIFDFSINKSSVYFPITKYIPLKLKTLINSKIKSLNDKLLLDIKKDAFKRKKCLIVKE